MPDKIFDNFVRDKLGHYPSKVPEGLWDKIVNDKDRRPKGFWWTNTTGILSTIAIAVVLTGVFFIVNKQTKELSNNNSTLQTTVSNNSSASKPDKKLITDAKDEEGLKNNNSQIITPLTTDKDLSASNIDVSSAISNKDIITTGFADASVHYSKKLLSFTSKNKQLLTTEGLENKFAGAQNESNDFFTVSDKKNASGEIMNSFRNNVYNRNNMYNPPLNLRSILGLGSDCPSANGYQRNDLYIEVYGSPDYTMKSLSGNGLSSAYLQKKDSAEKMQVGYTVGARFAKTVGDHFILKAGLQYSQINERFSLRSENQRVTTTVIVNRTVVRPQGDTTFNDTTTVTQIGYAIRTSKNHYRNLEIPISLGYEFGDEKDKWKFGVNGGVIVNIASSYIGETLDTSLNVVSYNSKSSAGFYNTKVGLSLYGGVSLIRNISDKLDVFAEPYFRYSLSNLSSSIGYSQRFSAVGLTLGVRMKLNNSRQHL